LLHPPPHAGTAAQWMRKVEIKEIKTGRSASVPVMCQHCAEPPCVDVCPTGASFKRADGIVLVDRHSCIGCRYCMMACPYKARSFVHETGQPTRSPTCRAARAASRAARCACTASTAATRPRPVPKPAPRPATAPSCSATSTTRAARSRKRVREVRQSTALRADLKLDPGVRYQGI
jgi:tetrathionate reductase subunit B